MADYVPIPLQTVTPDPMKPISGMLNIASTVQGMDAQKLAMTGQDQQNQAQGINLREKQGLQQVLSDPTKWQNQDGSTNYGALIPQVMKVAPTTGMDMIGKIAQTEQAATGSKQAILSLDTSKRQLLGQVAQSLQGSDQKTINNTFDAISKQSPELASALPMVRQVLGHASEMNGQKGVDAALGQLAQLTMTPTDQQAFNTPTALGVSNGIQTGAINTKPGIPGMPQGAILPGSTQTQMVPLGQQQGVGTDINGNSIVTRKDAMGNVQAPSAMPGSQASPQMSYPAGESPQTKAALEQEVMGAKNTALGAQQLHDINRTIVQEAENLKNGGTLGQLTQKLSSATGFNVGNESATGYNLLGKMLERSALTAAQSQGPHTNAGLEASVRANGSLDYTPDSLKTIARLNDALTTGSEKYAQGMQAAIDNGGSVFAKKKFDQQWSQNADVNALKFLSATKSGDKEAAQEVLKSVGGPGSEGAKKLAKQLQNLQSLTTKGSL